MGPVEPPTNATWRKLANDPHLTEYISPEGAVYGDTPAYQTVRRARAISRQHQFFHWPLEFPEVFECDEPGFDVVLGNPPWERIKLQEEEFFAERDADIARAPNRAMRQRLIASLPDRNPTLANELASAKRDAEGQSLFLRISGRFPLCGRGDINTYAVFAEQDRQLLAKHGRAGIIVQSDIATSDTYKEFFVDILTKDQLVSLYDFVNTEGIFPAVHRSHPHFCLLTISQDKNLLPSDFSFWNTNVGHLEESVRHFTLTTDDLKLLNPNSRTCPVFRSERDASLTKAIYRRVPVLIEHGPPLKNPWGINLTTMFHMSNDFPLFRTHAALENEGWHKSETAFRRADQQFLRLYEGRMGHQYNYRYATQPAGELQEVKEEQLRDPEFTVAPQYWAPASETADWFARREISCDTALLGFRRVTNNTNERTVIATLLPFGPASYGWILCLGPKCEELLFLLSNFNSFVFDYLLRNSLSQPSIPQGTFEQIPCLPPQVYRAICPWESRQTVGEWVSKRALELIYTSVELTPFANEMRFTGPPFVWDAKRRFHLRCELDAAFFHLYGLTRDDIAYVMDTFSGSGGEGGVRGKDMKQYGEYRTKRVIFEQYDAMQAAMKS